MPETLSEQQIPFVVFKAPTYAYVGFAVAAVLLTTVGILAVVSHPSIGNALPFLVSDAIFGLALLALYCFELKVTPDWIFHSTLFFLRKMKIEELGEVEIEIKTGPNASRTLIFRPRPGSFAPVIKVSVSILKREDLAKLAVFLPRVAPGVRYDKRFLALAQELKPVVSPDWPE